MSFLQSPFGDILDQLSSLLSPSKMRALTFATLPFLSPPTNHTSPSILDHVNPLIGTSGPTPNTNGGMIPSVAPPFAMTRWTPQTRENFISQCPYHSQDVRIHGFQATHQPAIWMGESGQVVLGPGVGGVRAGFGERGRRVLREESTAYLYEAVLEGESEVGGEELMESWFSPVPGGGQEVPEVVREGANGRMRRGEVRLGEGLRGACRESASVDGDDDRRNGSSGSKIRAAMTASSHVGHLRFDFEQSDDQDLQEPYVFLQATRQNWTGSITIDTEAQEVFGTNPQRQDYALGPYRAPRFSGYFVSRFSQPFKSYGVSYGGELHENMKEGKGEHLGGWVRFGSSCDRVEVRTGVSFVSIEQARRNLDIEAPPSVSFDDAVQTLKQAWLERLGRVQIEGVNETVKEHDQRTIFYTGLFHALQYPSDFSEPLETIHGGRRTWYEGYTDRVREGTDSYYQSWSIWVRYHGFVKYMYQSLTFCRIHSAPNTASSLSSRRSASIA